MIMYSITHKINFNVANIRHNSLKYYGIKKPSLLRASLTYEKQLFYYSVCDTGYLFSIHFLSFQVHAIPSCIVTLISVNVVRQI